MLRRREVLHKKGFTLVEVIVVLVILSILGTMTVPALTGQLRSGQEKKAVTEAQACVAAATDLAAQKYTAARTDYLNDNTKPIAAALNAWAGKVQDDGPEVTGDLILTEGTGQYLLEPTNADTGAAVGSSSIKQAAGVDGTVLNFWCNANGQVVYLLYKSADGITVAYTNRATSGTGSVVIPTANVPTAVPGPTPTKKPDSGTDTPTPVPTKKPATDTPTPVPTVTPTATPTVINGPKLIIHIENGVTKEKLGGWTFKMYPAEAPDQSFTVTANDDGNIEVGISNNGSPFVDYYMRDQYAYVLEDITVPDGYQALQATSFAVNATRGNTDVTGLDTVWVHKTANLEYKTGFGNSTVLHIPRYKVPYIHFRKVDSNGTRLSGAKFTLSQNNSVLVSFTSDASKDYDYSIPVKQNVNDGIRSGICIDLTGGISSRTFILAEDTAPENYNTVASQKFTVARSSKSNGADSFDAEFSYTDWGTGYSVADDSLLMNHIVTITDTPKNATDVAATCKVTISKKVYTYASADAKEPNGKELLPADKQAVLKLTGNNVSETWVTHGNNKTFTLLPGTYKLEEITSPNGYLQALPITFTVKTNDTSLDVEMLDTTTRDERDRIVIPGENSTITLIAENWAHKLTHDDTVKFNSELLSMNGILYYHYSGEKQQAANPNRDYYSDYYNRYDALPSDAPTPIEFLNDHGVNASDHIIQLTGKVYEWKENATVSLTAGDLVIYGKKFYVYISLQDRVLTLQPSIFTDSDSREAAGFHKNNVNQNYASVS